LGNIGENFYLQPDKKNPVKIWMNDFNKNGNIDKIITRTVDNRDVPVFLKDEMQAELPFIKKQNLQHADYAKKSIQDLIPADVLNNSTVKIFNYCSSVVAINKSNGNFEIKKMPVAIQLSSVNSICVKDINEDGYPDLIVGGNEDHFLPQFGRLDASFGDVLMNDGKGNFIRLNAQQTGLKIRGIIRDISPVQGAGNESYILFLRNNDFPVLCRQNNYLPNQLNQ
jgi:hypothetical protein